MQDGAAWIAREVGIPFVGSFFFAGCYAICAILIFATPEPRHAKEHVGAFEVGERVALPPPPPPPPTEHKRATPKTARHSLPKRPLSQDTLQTHSDKKTAKKNQEMFV